VRYQNIRSPSFSFVTIHPSDGQTDRQTEFREQYRALHYMQSHGKNIPPEIGHGEAAPIVDMDRLLWL